MSQVIVIESSPVSSGGNCYVTSGTPVTYSVVSGISGGIYVSYEWYLNGSLVSIGTGYTLTNPQQNDKVYVKILNCTGNGGVRIGDWIEDIFFYYNNLYVNLPYYIDLKASFDYEIISIVLTSDDDVYSAEILIDGITSVVWTTPINISPITTETYAVSSNMVLADSSVELSWPFGSGATIIIGKLKIRRVTTTTTTIP